MALRNNVPTNSNFLQGAQFLLGFTRLPYMNWFCTAANFPGISVPHRTQDTPFVSAPLPGAKLIYEPLEIKFIVDEQMLAYTTIADWIKGYALPEDIAQYQNLTMQQRIQMPRTIAAKPEYSDAILTVYTNKNNPTLQLKFRDLFPESLGSVEFATEMSAETIIQVKATFRYTHWEIYRFGAAQSF